MYRVNKRMRIINMTKDGKYTPSNGRDEHINQLLKRKSKIFESYSQNTY